MAELRKLGRYELRNVLGKGAMGVVYEGFDPTLNRRVAVKTILRSVAIDAETSAGYSARFVREAQAVARLNHPNIVQVHDFGEQDDVAYLVMEFIEGRELRAFFVEGTKFEPPEAVRVMGELLDALDFAHDKGVIHRDVKPANVMLDAQRRVKLADFGVARVQDSERSAAGTMVGTPAFMSPEQIQGGKIDRRTDLFSAGVVLYQLLTGEQPFSGEGAWTVARKIMQDDPPRPSMVAASVSPVFDGIVDKALAKNPAERFASAKEFAATLRAALSTSALSTVQIPVAAAPKPKAAAAPKASDAEVEFWRAIQNSTDTAEIEFYLEQFPDGTYAPLARHKIAKLSENEDTVRWSAEEKAARQAQARAKREAEDQAIREALEKTRREAAQKAKHEAEQPARRAHAPARPRHQPEAAPRAKPAVDEDATIAIGEAAEAPAPTRAKRSVVVPAAVTAAVLAAGVAAYLVSSRTPAPVAQAPAPAAQALAQPAPPAIDEATIRRETEERVRREYADKAAAEKAALERAAAAEKLASQKAAAEKAAAEKAAETARKAAEKAAAAKSSQEKVVLEKVAAIEKAAAERAVAAERAALAAERAAADRVAVAEKAAKAAAGKAAAEKAVVPKAAEKAAEPAKAPPVSVAVAAPREAGLPGRYAFRLLAGSGGHPVCGNIGIQEDIEIRAGSSQSISGRDFTGLQFQNAQDGSIVARLWGNSLGFSGTLDIRLAGRGTATGFAGTYESRGGQLICTGQWNLVRKSN